ncbi:hypothetical protein HDU97_000185 [Phlyctochytrium planicorne]|nr:hypothetical protein HDU97_000185 [Phlyctochytrium planicorne]
MSSKRKWDVPPEQSSSQRTKLDDGTAGAKLGAQDLAELAACKINAMLGSKTVAASGSNSIPIGKPGIAAAGAVAVARALAGGELTKDIEINDLKNRYLLTKGSTQAEIKKETGADVVSRGKYYADKKLATEKDPPLYLHVTAISEEILDKAVKKINELIEQASTAPQGASSGGYLGPPRGYSVTKLYIDFEPDKFFNIRAKIVGPQGSYMKHVQAETGCRMMTFGLTSRKKGKGSGFESQTGVSNPDEPLHLEITGPTEEALANAKNLCQDLVKTVREEFERSKQPPPPPPVYPYGYGYPMAPPGAYGGEGAEAYAAAADPYAAQQWDYSAWAGYDWSAYAQYAQPQADGQAPLPQPPAAPGAPGAPVASTQPPPPPPPSSKEENTK